MNVMQEKVEKLENWGEKSKKLLNVRMKHEIKTNKGKAKDEEDMDGSKRHENSHVNSLIYGTE